MQRMPSDQARVIRAFFVFHFFPLWGSIGRSEVRGLWAALTNLKMPLPGCE